MADPTTPAPAPYNSPFEAQFDTDRAQQFIIQKLIRGIHTAALVKVLAVYPTAGMVGFVDVQPLVLDQDTNGVVIAQTPIYNIPFFRLQAGLSAVILDPVVGDLGLCVFTERDSTNVLKTRAAGAAPTNRAYSSADGLYLGGVLNGDPTQWVKFTATGGIDINSTGNLSLEAAGTMTLHATGAMTITAASLTVNAPTTFNDDVTAPEIHLPNGAVNTHYHFVPSTPGNSNVMTG
jgi:hypothetical protein